MNKGAYNGVSSSVCPLDESDPFVISFFVCPLDESDPFVVHGTPFHGHNTSQVELFTVI